MYVLKKYSISIHKIRNKEIIIPNRIPFDTKIILKLTWLVFELRLSRSKLCHDKAITRFELEFSIVEDSLELVCHNVIDTGSKR